MALSERDKECVQAFRDELSHRLKWLFSDLFEHDASFRRQIVDAFGEAAERAVYRAELRKTGVEEENGH